VVAEASAVRVPTVSPVWRSAIAASTNVARVDVAVLVRREAAAT
jgi:hypothetical protein